MTRRENVEAPVWRNLLSYINTIIVALLVTVFIKTFLFQVFLIPSGSMENTLKIGDHVVVNMLGSHFSTMSRGEVVVFEDPANWMELLEPIKNTSMKNLLIKSRLVADPNKPLLIKRVIGVGGDHVICCNSNGKLEVNGVEITEDAYIHKDSKPSDTPIDVHVPEGYLFVMGDHRNNSADSRFHTQDINQGFVPARKVLGRAFITQRGFKLLYLPPANDLVTIQPNK